MLVDYDSLVGEISRVSLNLRLPYGGLHRQAGLHTAGP
jgi:hypothetical protein